MLLRAFRANHFYNFILLPIVGVLLLLKSFLNDGIFPSDSCLSTTPICLPLYNSGISFQTAISINFIAVIVICFLLLQINAKFDFVKERTFLPTYLYMFIVFALPNLHVIQPVFISAIFITLAIRSIFKSFEKRSAIGYAFDAGFFIGIAGIFYLASNLFVLIIPISIFILRNKLNWREFITPFIGLLIPWLFLFFYYFIWDSTDNLFQLLQNSLIVKDISILQHLYVKIYIAFLILITISASLFILGQYEMKNISTRRYFKILSIFFGSSLLLMLFTAVSIEILVILSLPLTFLLTNYLIFMKRRVLAEAFVILLVLFSFLLHYFI